MAWAYCSKCEASMSEPTVEEALKNEYHCKSCGHNNFPNKSMADIVIELNERLEALEANTCVDSDLKSIVLAQSVELSLLPNEAAWLKGLMQNPVYSNESAEDADYRASIFNKL